MKPHESIESLKNYFQQNKETLLNDFFSFLKFQSISSEPQYQEELNGCIEWLKSYLIKIGFQVDIWPTTGHPTLFASYDKAGPSQPTLLIYNHYDVQPVDPINLWDSPPFEPTEKNGEIYARGAQDNKGQCFYVLLALKALLTLNDKLPINIKLCIEGEEECGSAGLSSILNEKKEKLKSDYLAIVDLGFEEANHPAVTLGIRGIVTMDVEVTSTLTDLHSGIHGGVAFNPLHALVKILSELRDEKGKILIPHFYEDVQALSLKDKEHLCFHFEEEKYALTFGAPATGGELTYTPLERCWIRPTLEINGIHGGYNGDGFKTVIPSKASAKISCRLVPNQDPIKIGELVSSYLESHAPKGTKVAVNLHKGLGQALRSNIHSHAVKAFAKAYEEVFHQPCVYILAGGSIPIVAALQKASEAEVVMIGLGLPGDCIHAPNEHFGIDRIENGYLSIARAIYNLYGLQSSP